jgi:hypothetical protein
VALEAHCRSALHVEDNAIAVVHGRRDRLVAGFTGHVKKLFAVGPTEPGQAVEHLIGVYPTTGDALDVYLLPRQDRGAREVVEIGISGHRPNVLLPAWGKTFVQVERDPAEL